MGGMIFVFFLIAFLNAKMTVDSKYFKESIQLKLYKLRKNMGEKEVIEILGKPSRIFKNLHYNESKRHFYHYESWEGYRYEGNRGVSTKHEYNFTVVFNNDGLIKTLVSGHSSSDYDDSQDKIREF